MSGLEYLFVAQLVISIMLSIAFLVAWRTIEPRQHTLSWALLFMIATLQMVLNGAKDIGPTEGIVRDAYWVVVNAMSLGIQGLMLAGFRQRAGQRGWPRILVVYLVSVECLVIVFTLISFHQGLRMVLIPWSSTVLQLACIAVLLKPRMERKLRAAEYAAAVLFAVYGLSQFAAGAAALAQGAAANERWLELYLQINFIAMPGLTTGLGVMTVLILADDLAHRMRTLALTDSLTGVLNRRGFERGAAGALALCRRHRQPMSVAIGDLDHFKKINDTHGHHVGDQVLRAVARTFVDQVREEDIVGRMGGEEFAVILPFTEVSTALEVVERIRAAIEATQIQVEAKGLGVTISFGVATVDPDQPSIHDGLRHADQALYSAKADGRNRVSVYRDR